MSSFLVSHSTVDVILSCFWGLHSDLFRRPFEGIEPVMGRDAWTLKDEIGRALLGMNVDALAALYTSHRHDEERESASTYTYQAPRPLHRLAVVKAVDCLLYQAAEGDVPGRPLYRAVEELRQALVNDWLTTRPEWEAAAWDVSDEGRGGLVRIA